VVAEFIPPPSTEICSIPKAAVACSVRSVQKQCRAPRRIIAGDRREQASGDPAQFQVNVSGPQKDRRGLFCDEEGKGGRRLDPVYLKTL
jgi:hypothetical protein